MILGLTGTLGSGKSTVSGMLRDKGARIICADEIAREVVAPGTQALQEIVAAFGPEVLAPDRSLDRKALAARVFNDSSALRQLEAIIHPRVRDRELQLIETYRSSPLIILDIPLLFESGADALCDAVAVVTVDEDTRLQRLTTQRGMNPGDARRRIAAQMPQEEKVRRATHVINNSGSLQETERQVDRLLEEIVS